MYYIYIYIYIYVCAYIYIYMYTYIYIYNLCIHTYICMCIYLYLSLYTYIYIYIFKHTLFRGTECCYGVGGAVGVCMCAPCARKARLLVASTTVIFQDMTFCSLQKVLRDRFTQGCGSRTAKYVNNRAHTTS